MPSVNDQVADARNSEGPRYSIYADGVNRVIIGGRTPKINFRILPAYNPEKPDDKLGWVPFCDPEGVFAPWARVLWVSRFVGSGDKTTLADIVSMRTYYLKDELSDVGDPIMELYRTIKNNRDEWGYLLKGQKDGGVGMYGGIKAPTKMLVINISELQGREASHEARVAIFPPSTFQSVFGDDGLAFRLDPKADDDTHYLDRFSVGDITNPNGAFGLTCCKTIVSDKTCYPISVCSIDNKFFKVKAKRNAMETRLDLADIRSLVPEPTRAELIAKLVRCFSGVAKPDSSIAGTHEYELLRAAFPNDEIPEPRVKSSAQGFGENPAETQSETDFPPSGSVTETKPETKPEPKPEPKPESRKPLESLRKAMLLAQLLLQRN